MPHADTHYVVNFFHLRFNCIVSLLTLLAVFTETMSQLSPAQNVFCYYVATKGLCRKQKPKSNFT